MKKIALCVMAALLALSLIACGGSPAESKPAASAASPVEEFVNAADFQEELKTLKDTLAEQGMDISVEAQGNTMIMSFDLSKVEGITAESAAQAAEVVDSSLSEALSSMAKELSEKASVDASMEIRFVLDGESVFSKEYTAQ